MKWLNFLCVTLVLAGVQASFEETNEDIKIVEGVRITSAGGTDAYEKVLEFSKKYNNDIFAIVGSNGAGKTTLAKNLYAKLKGNNKKTLLFVDLYEEAKKAKENKYVNKVSLADIIDKKIMEVTNTKKEQLKNTKKEKSFVLILDHCEALFSQPAFNKKLSFYRAKQSLYDQLNMKTYKKMTVIAMCSHEIATQESLKTIFTIKRSYNLYSITDWDESRIKNYVSKNHNGVQYCGPFDIPIGTVKVAIQTSKKHQVNDFKTSWAWHEAFLTEWFNKQELSTEEQKETKKIMLELAMMMYKEHSYIFLPYTGGYSKHPLWKEFFKQKSKTWNLLLKAPIRRDSKNYDGYSFLFPSLREYVIAKAMLESDDNINRAFLEGEAHATILTMLGEAARTDNTVQNRLLNIIKTSKKPIANGNALSILAKAGLLEGQSFPNCVFSAKQFNVDNSYTQQGPYLKDANLRNINLEGSDLHGANLENADLSGANLKGADLRGANLLGANLENADLSNANLQGARAKNVEFKGTKLDKANLKDISIPLTTLFNNITDKKFKSELSKPPHNDKEKNNNTEKPLQDTPQWSLGKIVLYSSLAITFSVGGCIYFYYRIWLPLLQAKRKPKKTNLLQPKKPHFSSKQADKRKLDDKTL